MIYDFTENVNREAINTKETWEECFLNSKVIYQFHCDKKISYRICNIRTMWQTKMSSIMLKLRLEYFDLTLFDIKMGRLVVWLRYAIEIELSVAETKRFGTWFEYWGNMGIDICLWIV